MSELCTPNSGRPRPAEKTPSKLELGKKIPSWDRVGQIADHLGVHPLTIFTLSYLGESGELGLDELLKLVRSEVHEVESSDRAGIKTKSDPM